MYIVFYCRESESSEDEDSDLFVNTNRPPVIEYDESSSDD